METTKTCSKCRTEKSTDLFYHHASSKDGFNWWCKECSNLAARKYYQSPNGKIAKARHDKKHSLTTKGIASRKKAILKYSKTDKGKVQHRKTNKKYYWENRDVIRAHYTITQAIKKGNIKSASDYICSCCKNTQASHYHHDSYLPEDRLNVVPLCVQCHSDIHNNSV